MVRRVAVLAALASLAAAASAAAQSQSQPQTLTVTETARGGTSDVVDHPPKSPSGGADRRLSKDDTLVITNPLRDTAGRPIGRVRASCAITKAGGFDKAAADCLGVFQMKAGKLYVTLPLNFAASTSNGTVLGGTGAYTGLRGTWTSVQHRNGSSTDTFTLAP
jgi:hypothetical protein